MRRDEDSGMVALVTAILIALGVTAAIVHAEWVYDDWTCAVAKCVKVKR